VESVGVDIRRTEGGHKRVGQSSCFWVCRHWLNRARRGLHRREGGPEDSLWSGRAEESRGWGSARWGVTSGSVGGPRGGWFAVKREASQGCATELGQLHFAARYAAAAGAPTVAIGAAFWGCSR
jgi:hypothetical protein